MAWFSRQRTMEDITAPITNIVQELHDHAAAHEDKADRHFELVDFHHAKAGVAKNEADKAVAAAGKISALVS